MPANILTVLSGLIRLSEFLIFPHVGLEKKITYLASDAADTNQNERSIFQMTLKNFF